ncbi:MAG: lactate utilization protein B [Fimbriimonadaceae bacterium]
MGSTFGDTAEVRAHAAAIKDYVLSHLGELLVQLEEACTRNGIQVHWAADSAAANKLVIGLCRAASPTGGVVAKAKSMATEEIHLNHHLEEAGFTPVETDLGEFVIQIDHDTPSHIVAPIIHKNRFDVARSFEREHLGPYTEVPEELAMQARSHLRSSFQKAAIGISGVNFAVAESGRLVIIENEGNNRFSTTAPRVHIALMGIEKLLPREADLPLFLRLISSSATGQRATTYMHGITGPRRSDEPDGPDEVHLVLLDNGRTRVLDGEYREILRCIRCGACQNTCPVYRQASGHAYGHVYSGPIGAVLAPALEGVRAMGFVAKASSLCGACEEVCPVQIPIPRMLLQLRDEAFRAGVAGDSAPWSTYAFGATHPSAWRAGLKLLPMATAAPAPHPLKSGWGEFRELPHRQGRSFRSWWTARP